MLRKVVKTPEFTLFVLGVLLTAWGAWVLVAAIENSDPNSEIPRSFVWGASAFLLAAGTGCLMTARRVYRRRDG